MLLRMAEFILWLNSLKRRFRDANKDSADAADLADSMDSMDSADSTDSADSADLARFGGFVKYLKMLGYTYEKKIIFSFILNFVFRV